MTHPRFSRSALAAALLAAATSCGVAAVTWSGAAGAAERPTAERPTQDRPTPDRPTMVPAMGSYLAGRFAQHNDDWAAAAKYLGDALSADPGELSLMRRTFILKLSDGDMAAALGLARQLLEQDSEPQLAVTLLTADALKAGKLDAAEALAKRLPREGMGKFLGPLIDGWLAAARNHTDDAVKALSSLQAATGFAALYNLHTALVLDLGNRTEDAARSYAAVVREEAPLRVVQLAGNFDERTGRKDEARALYQRFHTDNPDSLLIEPSLKALDKGRPPAPLIADATQGLAEALFDLGSALNHEGAEETALVFNRIALHLRPDLALARIMVGDVLESHDHHDAALAEFKALESDPALGWSARLREADTLVHLERDDDAIALLSALATERPERTDALVRLGDVYRTTKRYGEAVDAYGKALERIRTPAERHWAIYYARALSYDKLDQWPKAEADLQQALKLRPEEPYLLNYLGYSWIDRGQNLDRARRMVERAVELRPRDGYIVDSLGWALFQLGDFDGAVTRLERAVELRPVDATINDHLGDAYWRVGRRNEARFQWQRALRTADEQTLKDQILDKLDKGLSDRRAAAAPGSAGSSQTVKTQ